MFLKNSTKFTENTCARVSFLIKVFALSSPRPSALISGPRLSYPALGPRSPKTFSTSSNSSNLKSSHYDQASFLSVVYGLSKPCWLTHATCTCFKETGLFFNVHWSCFVNFNLCPTDKFMFKVNNEKIRLICWMCSKSKLYTLHRSDVFVVDFDQSQ